MSSEWFYIINCRTGKVEIYFTREDAVNAFHEDDEGPWTAPEPFKFGEDQ